MINKEENIDMNLKMKLSMMENGYNTYLQSKVGAVREGFGE